MSKMPASYKVLLGGGLFLANHLASASNGYSPYEQVSGILRPNVIDAVGVTAAAMAPLDGKAKAIAVGGAWLAGRAYNVISDLAGFNDNLPEKIRSDASASLVKDMSTRTQASFDDAVAKEKALGKENEPAL